MQSAQGKCETVTCMLPNSQVSFVPVPLCCCFSCESTFHKLVHTYHISVNVFCLNTLKVEETNIWRWGMQPLVSFKPSPYPSSFQMILHLQSFTLCNRSSMNLVSCIHTHGVFLHRYNYVCWPSPCSETPCVE